MKRCPQSAPEGLAAGHAGDALPVRHGTGRIRFPGGDVPGGVLADIAANGNVCVVLKGTVQQGLDASGQKRVVTVVEEKIFSPADRQPGIPGAGVPLIFLPQQTDAGIRRIGL